jgi:hypothetical protein
VIDLGMNRETGKQNDYERCVPSKMTIWMRISSVTEIVKTTWMYRSSKGVSFLYVFLYPFLFV